MIYRISGLTFHIAPPPIFFLIYTHFIHSSSTQKIVVETYDAPDPVLGSVDTTVSKADEALPSRNLCSRSWRQTVSKEIGQEVP